jgi:hypothetical protein
VGEGLMKPGMAFMEEFQPQLKSKYGRFLFHLVIFNLRIFDYCSANHNRMRAVLGRPYSKKPLSPSEGSGILATHIL